jgi:hypothetical protein
VWNVQAGSEFVQSIHAIAFDAGWNLHLGGGTVTRGFSKNDLDVLAMPRFQTPLHEIQPLVENLQDKGWQLLNTRSLPHRLVIDFSDGTRKVQLIFYQE